VVFGRIDIVGSLRRTTARAGWSRVRPPLPWRLLAGLAAALAAVVVTGAPATAAGEQVFPISDDPFTSAVGQHRTEVEPDTFAFGSTMVAAFQVGRIFNGGAADIGWATTRNGGLTWSRGFLPATTSASVPAGPYFAVSDPSVAYDLRHHVWLISYLGLHASGGGVVDVLVSRSEDGGLTWGPPVVVAATGSFYDKNWTTCDDTPSSPFFGNCYTEFDVASQRDLEQMSTSRDGGLTWGPPQATADAVHGLGGQPVVQPDGRVVVPFEGVGQNRGMRAFTSDDGGVTWGASVLISPITAHRVAGDIRTSPLPSAELDRQGKVFVVWQDCRFEPGCAANDIVMASSTDGTDWSPVTRIPIDPVGSGVDHFIPGLAVDRDSAGAHGLLALTYYFYPSAACTPDTCRLEVGFTASPDGGESWSEPEVLAGPMPLSWLAATNQGVMVGDYISTSFLAGEQRVLPAFAVGLPPRPGAAFEEPMFSAIEKVRGGLRHLADDPVLVALGAGAAEADTTEAPTAF
jgi:hypothetical protein